MDFDFAEGVKPCPFCGCTKIVHGKAPLSATKEMHKFACWECLITGPGRTTEEKAKEAWNTRRFSKGEDNGNS